MEGRFVSLNANELNNFEWIKKHLGIKYYICEDEKSYKYLEIYIAEIFKDIKEEIEFIHVGWRYIKNKYGYLHGGGCIGIEDNTINGAKDKKIERYINMNKSTALRESLTLLDISYDYGKTLPLFLFSHLSLMKELFVRAGVEPKFILWLYGRTGSMKTSISKVFFNLFNRSGKEEIISTFKDTITAIEIKAFEYKDCVMLLDDYHPTTSITEKKIGI